jgi:small subunit ribosomal protein S17
MTEKTKAASHHSNTKERIGVVVSDLQEKTIIVKVERRIRHPRYEKVITKSAKFHVHDEENKASVGDRVSIRETRPLSKLKRWELIEILQKAVPVVALKA